MWTSIPGPSKYTVLTAPAEPMCQQEQRADDFFLLTSGFQTCSAHSSEPSFPAYITLLLF